MNRIAESSPADDSSRRAQRLLAAIHEPEGQVANTAAFVLGDVLERVALTADDIATALRVTRATVDRIRDDPSLASAAQITVIAGMATTSARTPQDRALARVLAVLADLMTLAALARTAVALAQVPRDTMQQAVDRWRAMPAAAENMRADGMPLLPAGLEILSAYIELVAEPRTEDSDHGS